MLRLSCLFKAYKLWIKDYFICAWEEEKNDASDSLKNQTEFKSKKYVKVSLTTHFSRKLHIFRCISEKTIVLFSVQSVLQKKNGEASKILLRKKKESFERIIFSWSFFSKSIYFSWSKVLLYFYDIFCISFLKSPSHDRDEKCLSKDSNGTRTYII